ncbi:MAG: leucine-rich repeat domain-containing protein [Dehalobacterium sp.]
MRMKIFVLMLVTGLIILGVFPVQGTETTRVIGEAAAPIDGQGTEEKPYRYLIDENFKVAWKHLIDNHEQGITEVYEYRDGYTGEGKLCYSYTFRGQDISPQASGPYFLEIRIYDGEAVKGLPGYPKAMFFSFATKRDFPGKTAVTLNVGDKFSEGTKLHLTYYGGYDPTVIHGAAPVAAQDEIRQVGSEVVEIAGDLTVSQGLVTFDLRYGGNYVLHPEPVDFSGLGVGEVTHYDGNKVLGTIGSVFPTEELAKVIAGELGKNPEDLVTQGDLDSIKSLYLSAMGLKSAEELSRVYFAKLESLTLSGNELESLNSLAMPALTYLDVSGNRLKSVNALAQLSALEHVHLAGNELISLPDLSKLEHLQTLDLSNNRLEIIPALAGGFLRYLDVSGNALNRIAGDLEQCPALETMVLTGQVFYTEAQIDPGEDFHLDPEPRFISQFGQGGRVTVTDSRDQVIYTGDFSDLEAAGFCLRGALFEKADPYIVTVTGYVQEDGAEKNLGSYTYTLGAGSVPDLRLGTRKITAGAVIIIFLGVGLGLVLHARRQKKRNEENRL